MSNIVVYGMGKTGHSLEVLLENQHNLYIYDDNQQLSKLMLNQIPFDAIDLMIVSPAVKPNSLLVEQCKEYGIEIVSELQYCFDRCKARCISVTGTNGKTTTTELIHHILSKTQHKSWLLGNGGVPFSQHLTEISPNDIVVHESSSFQLNFAQSFAPYISVLTNLSQEHLDFHSTYFNYIEAKCKNFLNQKPEDFSIFNADDSECLVLSRLAVAKKLFFSLYDRNTNCYFDGTDVVTNFNGNIQRVKSTFACTQLAHNKSNILAAILACTVFDVPLADCLHAIESFRYGDHRMSTVDTLHGVKFVDDSKSTNIHSLISALKCMQNDTALILGGSEKALTFDEIFSNLQNVSLLVLIGQTAQKIFDTAKKHNFKNVIMCSSMKHAVATAYMHLRSRNGGTVLLSPACASFDMFSGYAERGQVFVQCVEQLRHDYAE